MAAISILTGLFAALDPALMITTIALVGCLLVGAIVIAIVRNWQRRPVCLSPSDSEQLAQYRSLYEKGQISEEEYRRLRAVLGAEIRRASGLPIVAKTPMNPQAIQPPPENPAAPKEEPPPPSTGITPP